MSIVTVVSSAKLQSMIWAFWNKNRNTKKKSDFLFDFLPLKVEDSFKPLNPEI